MLNRHSVQSWKLGKIKIGLAAIFGFAGVPSVSVFGDQIIPPFFKLIFYTICGVVPDRLQSVHKGVPDDSGRVSEGSFGDNFNPLLLILLFTIAGQDSAGRSFLSNAPDIGDLSKPCTCRHSENLLVNQILKSRDENLADGQDCSPLKHNRAGIYEKGDCNQ